MAERIPVVVLCTSQRAIRLARRTCLTISSVTAVSFIKSPCNGTNTTSLRRALVTRSRSPFFSLPRTRPTQQPRSPSYMSISIAMSKHPRIPTIYDVIISATRTITPRPAYMDMDFVVSARLMLCIREKNHNHQYNTGPLTITIRIRNFQPAVSIYFNRLCGNMTRITCSPNASHFSSLFYT